MGNTAIISTGSVAQRRMASHESSRLEQDGEEVGWIEKGKDVVQKGLTR